MSENNLNHIFSNWKHCEPEGPHTFGRTQPTEGRGEQKQKGWTLRSTVPLSCLLFPVKSNIGQVAPEHNILYAGRVSEPGTASR